MPKSILIDLNIIVDIFTKRSGYINSRKLVLELQARGEKMYISASMVMTLSYILESARQPDSMIGISLAWTLKTFIVVPTDSNILRAALTSSVKDYEDAVVEQAAILSGAQTIITRNIKDFKLSRVPAVTPEDYLALLHP